MRSALTYWSWIRSIPPESVIYQPLSSKSASINPRTSTRLSSETFLTATPSTASKVLTLVPIRLASSDLFRSKTVLASLKCSGLSIFIGSIIAYSTEKDRFYIIKDVILLCAASNAGIKKAARCIRPAARHSHNIKDSTMNTDKYSRLSPRKPSILDRNVFTCHVLGGAV